MRMGFIFKNFVPTKHEINSATLIQKRHGSDVGVPKFSGVMSISVAAPSKPTTAGRRPRNTFFTAGVSMNFKNILLMRIISISDGNTSANVAGGAAEYCHHSVISCVFHCCVAAVCGGVDADGTWCHLTYRHDIRKLAHRHPSVGPHHLVLYQRQHTVAATEPEEPDFEECDEQIEVYHNIL